LKPVNESTSASYGFEEDGVHRPSAGRTGTENGLVIPELKQRRRA
jgi:hypothetical protein